MSRNTAQVIDTNTLTPPWAAHGAHLTPHGSQIAATVYAGLFEAVQPGGYYLWNTPDYNAIVAKCNELSPRGLALNSIDTEQVGAQTWFIGAWTLVEGGAWNLWRTTDWDSFTSQFEACKGSMRLLDLDIQIAEGALWYTGTWGGTPVSQTIVHDLAWDDFVARWKSLSDQGLRLARVQIFPASDTWHLTGIFEPGNEGYALFCDTDWNAFYAVYRETPFTLVDFQVYDDGPTRRYLGVWRQTGASQHLLFDQDWGSFIHQKDQLARDGLILQKAIRYPSHNQPPTPQWEAVFQDKLDGVAKGYSYAIMRDGKVILHHGAGDARAAQDSPQTLWTPQTRINLASVSKSITAVAIMKLLTDYNLSVDDPFYPLVQSQFPSVGPGVDTVTIRNLLAMQSGMKVDGTLFPSDIWSFLRKYLQSPAIDPGKNPPQYSNTNFTILQAVIDTVTGHGGITPDHYPTYVTENVLLPMGIDTTIFNVVPDPISVSTLSYKGASDPNPGTYWDSIPCAAAGGWISSADELAKFLLGVRSHKVLTPATTRLMLEGQLGWYLYDGVYGPYYHHNGGLTTADDPTQGQGLKTGIIQLAEGYDALLLINTWYDDTITLMIQAFEAR